MKVTSRRRNGRILNRYANAARIGVGVAARAYNSYTRSRTVTRKNNDNAVTTQHDVKRQYTRKAMPKYKKRKWVKFVKSVDAVDFKKLAVNHVVRAYNLPNITTTPTQRSTDGVQSVVALGLYAVAAEYEDNGIIGDVEDIWRAYTGGNNASPYSNRIAFVSAVSDIYVVNNATTTMILDVYHCICKKDHYTVPNLFDMSKLAPFPGNVTNDSVLNVNQAGVTPFQMPNVTAYYKILTKTKHIIGGGQTTTWQHRDPRNHYFRAQNFNFQTNMVGKAGLTHIWILCATSPDLCTNSLINYSVTQSRTYNVKVMQDSNDKGENLVAKT